jgi:hypothetical protein
LPQSNLFASSAEKYRAEDAAAEALESDSSDEDNIENSNPDLRGGELKIED